ncbi:MAG: FHA domain-containing protein, partial [Promethearchaeota archaeon]
KKTVPKKKTPAVSDKKEKITSLTPAFLEIEQIQLKIQLPFKNSIEMLGRQDFEKENLTIQIPEEFFSPIIKRDPESKASKEHCVIEQVEPKKYFLKDRSNLKKTYFNGVFVDSKGAQLKDGDKFLLPVMINEQLSSLTVIFHLEK